MYIKPSTVFHGNQSKVKVLKIINWNVHSALKKPLMLGSSDKPMGWMQKVAANEHQLQNTTDAIEMEIEKSRWDATTGRRLSRSRSKSKNIIERARSFERAAAEAVNGGGSANSSRAPSRQGSSNNVPGQIRGRPRKRSPSAGRQMAEFWQTEAVQSVSRPSSRLGTYLATCFNT